MKKKKIFAISLFILVITLNLSLITTSEKIKTQNYNKIYEVNKNVYQLNKKTISFNEDPVPEITLFDGVGARIIVDCAKNEPTFKFKEINGGKIYSTRQLFGIRGLYGSGPCEGTYRYFFFYLTSGRGPFQLTINVDGYSATVTGQMIFPIVIFDI